MDQNQIAERYLRQMDFANPTKFKYANTILGVGAVGSAAAIGISKVGNPRGLTLIDCDRFEEHNMSNQLSVLNHVGMPKAVAVAQLCTQMGAMEEVRPVFGRLIGKEISHLDMVNPSIASAAAKYFRGIVISTPDNMPARKDVWGICKYNPETPFVLDARIAGQYIQLIAVDTMTGASQKFYESTLFNDDEATPESCSGRGVIDCSLIAGGILTTWSRKLQLGEEVPWELRLDVTSWEVSLVLRGGKKVSNRSALAAAIM